MGLLDTIFGTNGIGGMGQIGGLFGPNDANYAPNHRPRVQDHSPDTTGLLNNPALSMAGDIGQAMQENAQPTRQPPPVMPLHPYLQNYLNYMAMMRGRQNGTS